LRQTVILSLYKLYISNDRIVWPFLFCKHNLTSFIAHAHFRTVVSGTYIKTTGNWN